MRSNIRVITQNKKKEDRRVSTCSPLLAVSSFAESEGRASFRGATHYLVVAERRSLTAYHLRLCVVYSKHVLSLTNRERELSSPPNATPFGRLSPTISLGTLTLFCQDNQSFACTKIPPLPAPHPKYVHTSHHTQANYTTLFLFFIYFGSALFTHAFRTRQRLPAFAKATSHASILIFFHT